MGGVDQFDQNVAVYRISIRKRRWWWPLFSWALSATANNAWQLSRLQCGESSSDFLAFIRSIVLEYLAMMRASRNLPKSMVASTKRTPSQAAKADSKGHFLVRIEKQRRCSHCHKKVQKLCAKCNVPLHVDCFPSFHTL